MDLFSRRGDPPRTGFPAFAPAKLADQEHRHELLGQLHAYVESLAAEEAAWYMRRRITRQVASLWIRFLSLLFLFLGGLCPLLPKDIPHWPALDFRPWGYFLIGIGGGLLLFDRLFGISASWMRFIIAAFEVNALLDDFRMRWLKIQLEAKYINSLDTFRAHIIAAEEAIKGIHTIVLLETGAWRSEFQSNINHQIGLWKNHGNSQTSTETAAKESSLRVARDS